VNSVFVYCIIKRIIDCAPEVTFIQEHVCVVATKSARKVIKFMVAVSSKSVVVQTKVPFNKTFCIVS